MNLSGRIGSFSIHVALQHQAHPVPLCAQKALLLGILTVSQIFKSPLWKSRSVFWGKQGSERFSILREDTQLASDSELEFRAPSTQDNSLWRGVPGKSIFLFSSSDGSRGWTWSKFRSGLEVGLVYVRFKHHYPRVWGLCFKCTHKNWWYHKARLWKCLSQCRHLLGSQTNALWLADGA